MERKKRDTRKKGTAKLIRQRLQEEPTIVYAALAKEVGVHHTTVTSIAKRMGLKPRYKSHDPALIAAFKRFAQSGYTYERIAQMHGVKKGYVKDRLREARYGNSRRAEVAAKAREAVALMETESLSMPVAAARVGITYAQLSGYRQRRTRKAKKQQQENANANRDLDSGWPSDKRADETTEADCSGCSDVYKARGT